jgi:hypothetical protein
MKRKPKTLFKILFFLYLAMVLVLCFGQFKNTPSVPFTILGIPTDKVVHFCMFFPFPILAFLAFDRFTNTVPASLAFGACTFVVGILLALGTEWGQATFTNYRTGDRMDLRADCIALFLSTAFVTVWDIVKQRRSCEKSSS